MRSIHSCRLLRNTVDDSDPDTVTSSCTDPFSADFSPQLLYTMSLTFFGTADRRMAVDAAMSVRQEGPWTTLAFPSKPSVVFRSSVHGFLYS